MASYFGELDNLWSLKMDLSATELDSLSAFKDVVKRRSFVGLKYADIKSHDAVLMLDPDNKVVIESPNKDRNYCDCNIF